ncbi:MAG TPA: DUF4185 domain-containing protein [Acidimicrobiales bacterium]|jgi:hypothetical protein|nr:DUF4185 domain-containing protein [Acidimicrobiales bacterium]
MTTSEEEPATSPRRPISRRQLLVAGGLGLVAAGLGQELARGALAAPRHPQALIQPGVLRAGPGPAGEIDAPLPRLRAERTTLVNRMIGVGGPVATGQRWYVYGADLGHMFEHQGRIYLGFGDTFGPSSTYPFLAQPPSDWRSNSLAWLTRTRRPPATLGIEGFVTNRPGHAKQLLYSEKAPGDTTVIPTYGISLGRRMVLHYMSVNHFVSNIEWTLNYSGLAYSDDDGEHWVIPPAAVWPGNSRFGQVAMVGVDPFVYLFGVPAGRLGSVSLARVRAQDMVNLDAYEYWDGRRWQGQEQAAATMVPAPVGELSVQWNSHYRAWLMTHQIVHEDRLVVRAARHLTGPWGDPVTIATGHRWPSCYAPFLTPAWNDGPELFYTMTIYYPYAVYFMRTRLTAV